MATKTLKHIDVALIGANVLSFAFSDTADNPQASYMLDDFARENYMHGVSDDQEGTIIYIPFHAVDMIAVEEQQTEVADKGDPYYCEPSGDGGDDGESKIIIDERVTTSIVGQMPFAQGETSYVGEAKWETITVTFGGSRFENIPRQDKGTYYAYGANASKLPQFEGYPFMLSVDGSNKWLLLTEGANVFTLVVETGSEVVV